MESCSMRKGVVEVAILSLPSTTLASGMDRSMGTMIVTGGSRGIGAGIAPLAGARGYHVVVNYASNADRAAEAVKTIEKGSGRSIAVQGDVSSDEPVLRH